MADLKPVSMKRTEADKRGDKLEAAPMEATAPDYPWGLCMSLEKRELDKLGIADIDVALAAKLAEVPLDESPAPFLPGDIVTWKLPGNLDHIGIDHRSADLAFAALA